MFSAIDSAGTRRSSCGMVTMPAAIASCGLAKVAAPAVDQDNAAVGTMHAAKDANERRLAGAVLADDGVDFADGDVEVDAGERHGGAEMLADALERRRPDGSCAALSAVIPGERPDGRETRNP